MGKTGPQEAPGDIMDYALQLGPREAMGKENNIPGGSGLSGESFAYIDSSLVYDFAC
jgi:hypothetical protein